MLDISCAFTGHRPNRFPFGYNEDDTRCVRLKAVMRKTISALADAGVRMFYSGMAVGADQWAAEAVLELKSEGRDLYLGAVLPCETQADRWPEKSRERYFGILTRCDYVKTLSRRYTRGCMLERDRFLVGCARYLIAVYDGEDRGGTAYTVRFGMEKGRRIITIHPETLAVEYLPAAEIKNAK